MPHRKHSVFWICSLPAAAMGLLLIRWLVQGSGNLYTDVGKRFYVPDEATGWVLLQTDALWVGLDSAALVAAILVATALGAWLLRRNERSRQQARIGWRRGFWVSAAAPLLIPIAAFATGNRPDGGRDFLPSGIIAAPDGGINASIADAPAGRYRVVPHAASVVVARLHAGGDEFEARFAGGLEGYWQGDPSALTQPMSASISASAGSVDTGISKRSKHATEYLETSKHPALRFSLTQLVATRGETRHRVVFTARGRIELMGQSHDVDVTGAMWTPRDAARTSLGLDAEGILVLNASFELDLASTALAKDLDSFDRAIVPITVTLVLAKQARSDSNPQGDQT